MLRIEPFFKHVSGSDPFPITDPDQANQDPQLCSALVGTSIADPDGVDPYLDSNLKKKPEPDPNLKKTRIQIRI